MFFFTSEITATGNFSAKYYTYIYADFQHLTCHSYIQLPLNENANACKFTLCRHVWHLWNPFIYALHNKPKEQQCWEQQHKNNNNNNNPKHLKIATAKYLFVILCVVLISKTNMSTQQACKSSKAELPRRHITRQHEWHLLEQNRFPIATETAMWPQKI